MELEITWKRVLMIWWVFFWRYLLVTFIVGFTVGFIEEFIRGESQATQWINTIIFASAGLVTSIFLSKWILKKDFGEFRLVLLTKQKNK